METQELADRVIEGNGQPKTHTLELEEREVGLLNQMLRQGVFEDSQTKALASGLQAKVERIIQEVNA